MSEHVEGTAGASMVETKDNTISQVIDEHRIVDLPLNGRQPTQLILLSGAALTTPGGGMTGSKNYFSSTLGTELKTHALRPLLPRPIHQSAGV